MRRQRFRESRETGGITVWCTMTLFPGLLLFLTLFLVIRFRIEQLDTARIAHLAGKAALTYYDEELYERYGFYGFSTVDAEENCAFFLRENSRTPFEQIHQNPFWLVYPIPLMQDLFRYEVVDVSIPEVLTLQRNDVFFAQIGEFMKFRLAGELVDFLTEQMELWEKMNGHGDGIQSEYALIQQQMADYSELYAELSRCLVPYSNSSIAVSSLNRENAERFCGWLLSAENGEFESVRTNINYQIEWWQKNRYTMVEKNKRAAELCGEIQELMDKLKESIQRLEERIAKLSDEERELESIQLISGKVQEIKGKLWGMKGEPGKMVPKLVENEALLTSIYEPLMNVYLAIRDNRGTPKRSDLYALRVTIEALSGYTTDFNFEQAELSSANVFGFGKVSRWLQAFCMDLTPYAENRDKIASDEACLHFTPGESKQDQISDCIALLEANTKNWWNRTLDQMMMTEYAVGFFRNLSDTISETEGTIPKNMQKRPFGKTFLKNETEYLIWGSWNEYENAVGVQAEILGIRTVLNMFFLLTDPVKSSLLTSIAENANLVIPFLGQIVVQGALVFLWASAEAYLDYTLLLQGGSVPLIKNEFTWQSDLKGILKRSAESMKLGKVTEQYEADTIEKLTTMDYEMYLRMLLLFTDQQTLVQRIRNLITLNLQMSGDKTFSFTERAGAFSMTAVLKGAMGIYDYQESFIYYGP